MTLPSIGSPVITQPWSQVIFPPPTVLPTTPPMTAARARSIPSLARVLQLISGLIRQMPMDDYRGVDPLPRPRMLEAPDPTVARSWWVGNQVDDYLLHGNAVHVITSRDATGWPASAAWVPAEWITITWDIDRPGQASYWVGGERLPQRDVVHVRRGADPWCPYRGVGLVEQHLGTLTRVAAEEAYEASILSGAAVPSVVVISPNPDLSQEEATDAQTIWESKYGGDRRRPAVLPAGTQVMPLSWSPTDAQLNEARKLSLLDVANLANLDGYWVGAPASSFTYRSPGPMYLNLIRQTIAPITEDFELTWSDAWLPRGRRVRFDRSTVLRDDQATEVNTLSKAITSKIMTVPEARVYLGLTPEPPPELVDSEPEPPAIPGEDLPSTTSPVTTTGGPDDQEGS
jgi:HK97 family phage portal protein